MALKPAGGKYEGVWVNELRNGDISYYINYRNEQGKPVKIQVGKKTASSDFTVKDAYSKLIEVKYKLQHDQVSDEVKKQAYILKTYSYFRHFGKFYMTKIAPRPTIMENIHKFY